MKKKKITQGKEIIIDDDDFEKVNKNKWSYHHTGYVVRGKPQISLHRFIMGAKHGQYVDHINGNKLDNRKSNLRFCTPTQNQWNSKYQDGIHWRENRKAWIVRMTINGQRKYIGYFKSKKDAINARKSMSLKTHKIFSPYGKN